MQKILQFKPIYKSKIWGGKKLRTYFNRSIEEEQIGESWEVSDFNNDLSEILNGNLKGKTFRECYKKYPKEILGAGFDSSKPFPLLVKIIDATDKLSLQVHPDDAFTEKYDPSNHGKKEAWYILQSDPNSEITLGFSKDADKTEFEKFIKEKKAEELLQKVQAKKGDSFLINPGTIHGIGGGNLILEVQQSSDSTYRVYDYGRVDSEGKERDLHLDKAMKVLNFKKSNGDEYSITQEISKRQTKLLVSTDKFRMELFDTSEPVFIPSMYEDNLFQIVHVVEGSLETEDLKFHKGDTFFATATGMQEKIKIFPKSKKISLILLGI